MTTDDPVVADRLRLLRNHGSRRSNEGVVEFVESGFNYRLSEIPAALGLSQLQRIEQILHDRRVTAGRYDEAFLGMSEVGVPKAGPDATWSYQSYVVVLDEHIDRDAVIARMANSGIETTVGTYACHKHPAFSKWVLRSGDLPNSARFAKQTLTLPVVPRMTASQVDRVVEALFLAIGSS